MKKVTIILLTAIYLLSAIGVSASSFYCCGILKTTTFSIGAVHDNGQKVVKGDNCCKTTKQSFKVKDNHFSSDAFSLSVQFFPAIVETSTEFKLNAEPFSVIHTAFNSHAPPLGEHTPIYTLNCTYRI